MRTVRDLIARSLVEFDDRRERTHNGFDEPWRPFAVSEWGPEPCG